MKTAPARRQSNLRPKHKKTKKYLKHYYPFIPLLVSITALIMIISPISILKPHRYDVLAYSIGVDKAGLVETTNNARAKEGISQLTFNDLLSQAAQAKANDMASRNYWSHTTPDGKQPWIFIAGTGYKYQKAGENLAYGFRNNSEVITGWLNSPSHRENMLDSAYTQVGFGIANSPDFNNSGPSTIVVAMYAKPLEDPVAANTTADPLDQQRVAAETTINSGTRDINRIQTLTGKQSATYVVATSIVLSFMYLTIKHTKEIKRLIRKGEKYIVKHPLLDSIIISLIAIGLVLLQRVGSVL